MNGYFYVQGLCIGICPYGFTTSGTSCTINSNAFTFFLDLNNVILGTLYDSQSNLEVTTGVDSSFYPSYDTTDPYATKERGYYFTGTSYMNIAANSLTFAPLFTIYS